MAVVLLHGPELPFIFVVYVIGDGLFHSVVFWVLAPMIAFVAFEYARAACLARMRRKASEEETSAADIS
jgi:hypothetical protein